ncbi:MAG: phosphatidylserine/phosphatidylglycerophosphate/cardiolipin synthase family protein [Myxococcales bacterium]|nr:phosphatidylserine/phosphatidylglycerophosphate/cardiolipin synthase family protein [Myxococcales bacterium]
MSESVERSADGWSVTYRQVVDHRTTVMPPVVVPRIPATGPVHGGTRVIAVNREGRALARIVAAIEAARATVVVGSFLMSSPELEKALLGAANRGVRVYVLVAAEARLLKEPKEDSEFDQRMIKQHKEMLDRLAGWVLIRTAGDWHAKVVLVDQGPAGQGFLLTANLTAEALSRNEELVVELTAGERAELREVVRWGLWGAADHEVVEPGKLTAVQAVSEVPKPVLTGGAVGTLREAGSLGRAMLDVIASARSELMVASFGWDVQHPVVAALCARARAGVAVTVLARARPACRSALIELARAGARVLIFEWLHAKAIWSDAGTAIVASANLEPQGLDRGVELGVVFADERHAELRDVLRGWAAKTENELRVDVRLGELLGPVHLWSRAKLDRVEVMPTFSAKPETTVAASADRLVAPPMAAAGPGLPLPLAHEHVITRIVSAPVLEAGLKPVDVEDAASRLAVFRGPKGKVVVVSSVDQLEAAAAIAKAHGGAPIVVERKAP